MTGEPTHGDIARILGHLQSDVTHIRERVDDVADRHDHRLNEHAKDIKSLNRSRHVQHGAAAILVFVISTLTDVWDFVR